MISVTGVLLEQLRTYIVYKFLSPHHNFALKTRKVTSMMLSPRKSVARLSNYLVAVTVCLWIFYSASLQIHVRQSFGGYFALVSMVDGYVLLQRRSAVLYTSPD